jgi:hypothetical protein
MRRARRWSAAVLTLAVVLLASGRALVPAGPATMPRAATPLLWSGAYHVHTTRSDGSGTPNEVAAAAARAGLQFVVLTDHGDGTREPLAPAYRSGVLVIDGVEISTNAGHYVALDLPRAPYPLAGDARDVAEDVRRLGGLGILAHPDSTRPSLAWHDWDTRGDGLEILNADSAWRDESVPSLLRLLPAYPWRPSAVLSTTLSYPAALLGRLDAPVARSPRLGLVAVDAHASIGLRPREEPLYASSTIARVPSYVASFGTFGLALSWDEATGPTGIPQQDARTVLDALRAGQVHNVVYALAAAAPLTFTAIRDDVPSGPGTRLSHGPVRLAVEHIAVEGSVLRLLRNGEVWREQPGDHPLVVDLDQTVAPAVYRAEVWLPRRWRQPAVPWMVSQAIAVGTPLEPSPAAATPAPEPAGIVTPVQGTWTTEHDPTTAVRIEQDAGRHIVRITLGAGVPASQFGAAAIPWPAVAGGTPEALTFTATGAAPMRVSVQVREPGERDGRRWLRSVYLDTSPRLVRIPLSDMRPVWPASGAPPVDRLHAILLVVDTVNARPGDARLFTVENLGIERLP